MVRQPQTEAERLEQLWSGDFGDAYSVRNTHAAEGRRQFWAALLTRYSVAQVLEVGCNFGPNLAWVCEVVPSSQVFGVDVNESALYRLHHSLPRVGALCSAARSLPFPDKCFDLVFTSGVLIHQPEASLPLVMSEIFRCARRFVLCMEYSSESTIEVPYRGQHGALFKRNYGQIYKDLFPTLQLLEKEEVGLEQGWDNVTSWMFEKTRSGEA